jgi:hypothetical protein
MATLRRSIGEKVKHARTRAILDRAPRSQRTFHPGSRIAAILVALGATHCAGAKDTGNGTNGLDGAGGASLGGAGPGSGGLVQGGGGVAPGAGGFTQGGAGFSPGGGGPGSGGEGVGGSGSGGSGQGGSVACTGSNTAPGFQNLAPPMGAPLDPQGGQTPLVPNPAPLAQPDVPQGYVWYTIDGAMCRDGSPTGFYVKFTSSDKLLIYLEGGGACSSPGFCNYNPKNVGQHLAGDGQTVLNSAGGATPGRQQPGVFENGTLNGIFDETKADNPFKDWNKIYIPYCTGDVHFGTRTDVVLPNMTDKQQFVGYLNMQKFIGRIVPTFKDKVSRVILTGASAGGFGAALNYSMVQDAFGCVKVDVLDDSGPPFSDQYLPVCMQKKWREIWGLDAALPPDCSECQQADGGGLVHLSDFLIRKHPNATIALVSSMQDEVIRLFYSSGLADCKNFETADPVSITIGQLDPTVYMVGSNYENGLNDLRTTYKSTGKFASYYLGGANLTFHQHTWRARFYDPSAGTETIAAFTQNFLNGQMDTIGP